MAEPETPLPRAPVLGYLSNMSTPTRVRVVAARGVLWVAMVLFLISTVLLVVTARDVWRTAVWLSLWRAAGGGPPALTMRDVFDALVRPANLVHAVISVGSLLPPGLLIPVASPIRRGRRIPAIVALVGLVSMTLLLTLATATTASAILVVGVGWAGHAEPMYLLWLMPAPIAILVILLLGDLGRCLLWIARNPLIEKPPTPFLRQSVGPTSRG
jgi:hypothetical protein